MFTISKKGSLIALAAIYSLMFISSCKNKDDYQVAREKLLQQHDKVMEDSGNAESKEMQFDLLLKSGLKQLKLSQPLLDTAATRAQIIVLNKKLRNADNQMENWMHAYNNDFKGRTDREAFDYYTGEEVKVARLDSVYNQALKLADDYLKKIHIKPDSSLNMDGKMKM